MRKSSEIPSAQLFTSSDFKAGPQVLTIASIESGTIRRTVLFKETKCRSLLTRKREHVIETLFGSLKDAVGKRIELFRHVGKHDGKNMACVTFRAPRRK